MTDLKKINLEDCLDLLKKKKISSEELVSFYLKEAEKNKDINAFISLNSDNELYLANPRSGNNMEKIFKSSDLGNSWENLTTSKLNGHKIKHLHVQEGTDGGVYIASFKYMWYKMRKKKIGLITSNSERSIIYLNYLI